MIWNLPKADFADERICVRLASTLDLIGLGDRVYERSVAYTCSWLPWISNPAEVFLFFPHCPPTLVRGL